jgi:bacterial/archaeal transporter family protein
VDWLFFSFGFAIAEGTMAIVAKFALRSVSWPVLVMWAAIAYAVVATGMVLLGGEHLAWGVGAAWALGSGLLASGGLIVLYVALGRGEASRVIPITAAYPVVTAVLAALFLAERVTAIRIVGTVLVVIGIMLLSRDMSS